MYIYLIFEVAFLAFLAVMDPDLKKKWKDAMETAKLTGGGGGNGVDTANIMLGKSV